MSHYSVEPGRCRVDFFKPSGKWYMTDEVDMSEMYATDDTVGAVGSALEKYLRRNNHVDYSEFVAVCLEPYTRYSFPVMGTVRDLLDAGRYWIREV